MRKRHLRTSFPLSRFQTLGLVPLMMSALSFSPSEAKADAFSNLLAAYSSYDYDADGTKEINSLSPLFTSDPGDLPLDATSKLVVVLVETRIIDGAQGSASQATDLRNRLLRLKADLAGAGMISRFVEASVYSGAVHQDGKTLLALRRFLKGTRDTFPALQGALLVGSFPEALLVREWIWERGGRLQIVPEVVDERAELVLADLDGNWENIYNAGPSNLTSIIGDPVAGSPPWPQNNQTLTLTNVTDTTSQLSDFFYIMDDSYSVLSTTPTFQIHINNIDGIGPELATSDTTANPIARPDIFVSRINARNVAVNPNPNFVDTTGRHFLDANGNPQTVQSTPGMYVGADSLVPDLGLERRVLLDYFDRNHRYRVGGYTTTQPYACVSFNLSANICTELQNAGLGSTGTDTPNASLVDYVNWLTTSTTLRGIVAHSNPWNSAFGGGYTDSALANVTGAHPWRWRETPAGSGTYVPTLDGLQFVDTEHGSVQAATADQFLGRTLWENGILANTSPALYIHSGCQVNSPASAASRAYDDPMYARFQNAEGVLFFLNGVGVLSRAKIFYDDPVGVGAALAPDKAFFGQGWAAYFDEERANAGIGTVPSDRKRAYNWSEIGDWSTRKSYANGIGVLGIESKSGSLVFDADTVAADKTWLNGEVADVGWNYDVRNANVKAVADFDGDGKDEFLLDSTWGIGLIDRLGSSTIGNQRFAMVAGGPSGSTFGAWTYNRATDIIVGTGNFDGGDRKEILVSNSSGIGILRYDGSQITSVISVPNYTSLGGWTLNTADNSFFIGKFSTQAGATKSRILITSSWGVGIFELSGSTLVPIASAQNGTNWGSWTVSTSSDVIQGIGDFDGNKTDDILVQNGSNLGILTLNTGTGNTLVSLMKQPSGTWFGGWHYTAGYDVIRKTADLDTDANNKADILIRNPGWIGVLTYANGTLTSQIVQPEGSTFGAWTSAYTDVIEGVGDFTGDGKVDILVSNRYTNKLGILTLAGGAITSQAIQPLDGSLLGSWVNTPCVNIVGVGEFDGDAKSEFLAQPRPDGCLAGVSLGDAWNQGAVAAGEQYPRDLSVFTLADATSFSDVEGPVASGGNVSTSSFNLNWGARGTVALVAAGGVQLSYGTVHGDVDWGTSYNVSGTTVTGTARQSVPINFSSAFAKLQALSQGLKELPANGNTTLSNGALIFSGTDPDLNVFTVSSDALVQVYSIALKVPPTSTVIINITGPTVTLSYMGFNVNGQAASKILVNYPDATSVVVNGAVFPGSMLAPQASVSLWWGVMHGTLVAASANIHSEIHWAPFRDNWLVP